MIKSTIDNNAKILHCCINLPPMFFIFSKGNLGPKWNNSYIARNGPNPYQVIYYLTSMGLGYKV
jgi:hypothetical protein